MIKAVSLVTYKEWAAYRTHSLVSVFVGPAFLFVQFLIWNAVYKDNPDALSLMLRYYAVTTLTVYLTMDFADWNLQMLIHTGKYLTFAMRPVHHRFFALSQKTGHRFLGLIFEFIPVALIFALVFNIDLRPASIPLAAVSLGLCFLMNFYVNYIVGLTGFWLTRTNGLRSVVRLLIQVSSGSLLPLFMFPLAAQRLFMFLPFPYISYVPAMVYLGTFEFGGVSVSPNAAVAIQAAYVLAAAAASEFLYRLGNRAYTGVGI